ncbi:hypothetical protein STSP2_00974 [Anaerohalosphaera lusitana]|uniref:Uncharacterized protein n=1 Tax=Anaerohalosphaera lusitana TaxID=1936003 RepID=A0A1U9NJB4_9BACT|nr:hypothetical protein STSP2_00974 [Anaerohalosphaera lusitana]
MLGSPEADDILGAYLLYQDAWAVAEFCRCGRCSWAAFCNVILIELDKSGCASGFGPWGVYSHFGSSVFIYRVIEVNGSEIV